MSHLDEGTLHALLDGELDAKEVREIQAHLGSCSACGTRLQSVKEIAAESDRLVGAIQFPGTPRRPAALDPAPPPSRELPPEAAIHSGAGAPYSDDSAFEPPSAYEPPTAFEPPPSRPPRSPEPRLRGEPIYDESPPVLLVPDDNQWAERRRRLIVASRWAALVFVAVGAGYIASEARRTQPVPSIAAPALSDEPAPVVSAAEQTARPDSGAAPAREVAPARAEPPRTNAAAQTRRPAPAPAAAPTAQKAAAPEDSGDDFVAGAGAADESDEEVEEERQLIRQAGADPPPPANVREEAAEALARLDRERRRERAAAATAALDNEARRRAAATRPAAAATESAPPSAPAPAPAPRTLEQRSNIYLRIGLDEAARQLGRPVHVIEGMQQQFMGLAQGVASPAADATRPVVRVVYQDNQGRMILLDQQRIRPGQTWSATETRWVIGEIGLALLGEPGPEILRNLRPRVR